MFSHTPAVVEIRENGIVISDEGLMRIVEMPNGKTVKELADGLDIIAAVTADFEGDLGGKWRIAVSYELSRILKRTGVKLLDLTIPPIGRGCCPWCGASARTQQSNLIYQCGTVIDRGAHDFAPVDFQQSNECRLAKQHRSIVLKEKSDALHKLLEEAGAIVGNDEKWWLVDCRRGGTQFELRDPDDNERLFWAEVGREPR